MIGLHILGTLSLDADSDSLYILFTIQVILCEPLNYEDDQNSLSTFFHDDDRDRDQVLLRVNNPAKVVLPNKR